MKLSQEVNKGRTYIETPLKYYFTDLGLRNASLGFSQIEVTHAMENVVSNELKARGYNVDVGVVSTSWKKDDGRVVRLQLEVDFVCNRAGRTFYIQSAYSLSDEEKRNQETSPFTIIKDSFKKKIITKDIVKPHYDDNGILTMSIYDFLLDTHSIEKYRRQRQLLASVNNNH